jgi:hypothetical protein
LGAALFKMADSKFQEVCATFYTGIIGSIARKLADPTFMVSLSGKSAQQINQLIHEAAGIPIAVAPNSPLNATRIRESSNEYGNIVVKNAASRSNPRFF